MTSRTKDKENLGAASQAATKERPKKSRVSFCPELIHERVYNKSGRPSDAYVPSAARAKPTATPAPQPKKRRHSETALRSEASQAVQKPLQAVQQRTVTENPRKKRRESYAMSDAGGSEELPSKGEDTLDYTGVFQRLMAGENESKDTQDYTQILSRLGIKGNAPQDTGETMEFTQPLPTNFLAGGKILDETMEFTAPLLTNFLSSEKMDETMDFTGPLHSTQKFDDTMEFTAPLPTNLLLGGSGFDQDMEMEEQTSTPLASPLQGGPSQGDTIKLTTDLLRPPGGFDFGDSTFGRRLSLSDFGEVTSRRASMGDASSRRASLGDSTFGRTGSIAEFGDADDMDFTQSFTANILLQSVHDQAFRSPARTPTKPATKSKSPATTPVRQQNLRSFQSPAKAAVGGTPELSLDEDDENCGLFETTDFTKALGKIFSRDVTASVPMNPAQMSLFNEITEQKFQPSGQKNKALFTSEPEQPDFEMEEDDYEPEPERHVAPRYSLPLRQGTQKSTPSKIVITRGPTPQKASTPHRQTIPQTIIRPHFDLADLQEDLSSTPIEKRRRASIQQIPAYHPQSPVQIPTPVLQSPSQPRTRPQTPQRLRQEEEQARQEQMIQQQLKQQLLRQEQLKQESRREQEEQELFRQEELRRQEEEQLQQEQIRREEEQLRQEEQMRQEREQLRQQEQYFMKELATLKYRYNDVTLAPHDESSQVVTILFSNHKTRQRFHVQLSVSNSYPDVGAVVVKAVDVTIGFVAVDSLRHIVKEEGAKNNGVASLSSICETISKL